MSLAQRECDFSNLTASKCDETACHNTAHFPLPFFFFLPYFDVKELKHISVLDALEQQKLWF